jgi:plastocyanin
VKKYLIGLFLVLVLVGCQQQPQIADEGAQEIEPAPEVAEEPQPEGVEEAPAEVAEEAATEAPKATEGTDVRILGKGGFDPAEIRVGKGATVTFLNDDPAGKEIGLVFQKGRQLINSDRIKAGEKYEHTFEGAGTYNYWTLEYGVRGKVVVE